MSRQAKILKSPGQIYSDNYVIKRKRMIRGIIWSIKKPWDTFTQDARKSLEHIVGFKQNLRVINKSSNTYQCFDEHGIKVLKKQVHGDNLAIRKPMHKDTAFGSVNLRRVKEARLSVALDAPSMIVDKKMKKKVLELMSYKYDKKGIERYFKENIYLWKNLNLSKVPVYCYRQYFRTFGSSA